MKNSRSSKTVKMEKQEFNLFPDIHNPRKIAFFQEINHDFLPRGRRIRFQNFMTTKINHFYKEENQNNPEAMNGASRTPMKYANPNKGKPQKVCKQIKENKHTKKLEEVNDIDHYPEKNVLPIVKNINYGIENNPQVKFSFK